MSRLKILNVPLFLPELNLKSYKTLPELPPCYTLGITSAALQPHVCSLQIPHIFPPPPPYEFAWAVPSAGMSFLQIFARLIPSHHVNLYSSIIY